MIFEILIPGKPVGKQRPKATIRGHHAGVYTPKETVAYERYVVAMFLQAYPCAKPLEGEVKYYSDEPRVEIMIEEER